MSFQFRRVITGHNPAGQAVVKEDETVTSSERLPGYQAATVWCTDRFPVNNDEETYSAGRPGKKGTRVLLRIGEMQPGEPASQHIHRTETLDYAVVLSGYCDMALDSGEVVARLGPGDVVIQRGTNHGWIATGPGPVKLLFVLIDAEPVRCGDKLLGDFLDNFGGRISPMPQA